jgi:hypothetical protein
MTNPKICYRFVKYDMTSEQGNVSWKINKWNKIEGKLKCCETGLHASITPLQSLNNVYGNRWFIAEYKGKIDKKDNKFCASEMRLLKEIPIIVIKRFAIFCAKDCLKNYEKEYPKDKIVADAIKAAEDYLDGKINLDELSAARSAAESARLAARLAAEKRQEKELKRLIKEYVK